MFHPTSLFIPFMVLLPNLLFFRRAPHNMSGQPDPSLIFSVAEGIGRIGTMIVPLFFAVQLRHGYEMISLIVMILSLLLYYGGWCRYFLNDREYGLLFKPFRGIPIPLAISPVLYFLAGSVILHSFLLFMFSIVFAAGHIPNSLRECERILHRD